MSRDPGRVRPAREQDLDRLCFLALDLAREHAERDPRFAIDASPSQEAEMRGWLAARQRKGEAFLAVHESGPQLDGWILASFGERPPPFRERRFGAIEQLYVRPEARRGGVGAALVGAARDWLAAAGASRVVLEVAVENPEARAFWTAQGFVHSMDGLDRPL